MSEMAIFVQELGKQYRIGGRQERYKTLRDVLADSVMGVYRRVSSVLQGRAPAAGLETIWALRDVSFEVRRGEVIGVIGRNGAGKTTLLKILSRITEPNEGYAEIRGRVGSLLEVGTGFHPELTGRENVYLNGAILGMRKQEIDRKFDEIVSFAEVEKFIDTPVKHYSSGMFVRLAFAVAAHLETEILLVDEVLAVGDLAFQRKCLGKMGDVARQGRTVLLVSHNMGAILDLCHNAICLDQGTLLVQGEVNQVVRQYEDSLRQQSLEKAPQGQIWFGPVLAGRNGQSIVPSGEGIRFTTTLGLYTELSGCSLFCIVENARGEMLLHSRVESTELDLDCDGRREYEIVVDTPPLWLNPGVYTVYFKILAQGTMGSRGRHLSDRATFTVVGRASPTSAALNPPVEWSFSPKR